MLALEAFKKKASEKESAQQVVFQAKLDEQIK